MRKEDPKQPQTLDQIQIESPPKPQAPSSSSSPPYPQMHPLSHSHHPRHSKQAQDKTLYEETYYLTGLRENYLVMISDNMHIIQLPVGLLKTNVAIGDPIRLKLELDAKRVAVDRRKFFSVQEQLVKQYTNADS